MEDLRYSPLSARMGIEITNIDLGSKIAERHKAQLRVLLDRHKLLVFRDQSLTLGDHIRAVELFGVPVAPEYNDDRAEAYFDATILPDHLPFHQDYEFSPWPSLFNSLYAMDIDVPCAPTVWASIERPVEQMDAAEVERLSRLTAVHSIDKQAGNKAAADITYESASEEASASLSLAHMRDAIPHGATRYPIIRPHPRTGVPILYVSEGYTGQVDGLSESESAALLESLFQRIYAEENLYTHHWAKRDFAIWDNMATQHSRPALAAGVKRTFRRMLAAEKKFTATMGEQWSRGPAQLAYAED